MTVRFGDFEWDEAKARVNQRKHGVTFLEAVTVFLDPLGLDLVDDEHANRWILVGRSALHRTLLVVYATSRGRYTANHQRASRNTP